MRRVEELISGPIFLTEMIKNGWQTSIRGEERKEEEKNIFLIYTPKTKLQFSAGPTILPTRGQAFAVTSKMMCDL